jgi:hypothetical protein
MTPSLLIGPLSLEPLERLATQLALLLTNIARFDFPGRAPNMLNQLISVAGERLKSELVAAESVQGSLMGANSQS